GLRTGARKSRAMVRGRARSATGSLGDAGAIVRLHLRRRTNVAYGGQMNPVPSGALKHPTDCGRNCFGSHNTTFGNITVNAMVRKNTIYNGSERTTALPKLTPTYFDATSSESPYGGVIRPNTSVVMMTT